MTIRQRPRTEDSKPIIPAGTGVSSSSARTGHISGEYWHQPANGRFNRSERIGSALQAEKDEGMNYRRLRRATRRLAIAVIALAAFAAAPTSGRADSAPQDTIRSFYTVLLNVMKSGATFGGKGRYDVLLPTIRQDFDLPYMSRMAVGTGWTTLSSAQKQAATDAFAHYITATYANNFDSYSGERFEVTGTRNTPYGTIVESRLVQSNGKPVTMNYLMHRNDGTWRIGDIYLTGTISQLANLRSQFSSVLARAGADGLVAALNRKTATLLASDSQ